MPSAKKIAVVGAGVIVGSVIAPTVLGLFNIEQGEGFGMDDIIAAAVIATSVVLVDRML